ncbi:hypothetical protein NC651_035352 [Populus alba x Populus x berolinensis]|nr:hypothetical protein NC651_035352 [Populus alba x Populus x berolinensis]
MAGLQMAGIRIRTFLACDCATMRGRGPRFFTCLASAFFVNSSSMKDRQVLLQHSIYRVLTHKSKPSLVQTKFCNSSFGFLQGILSLYFLAFVYVLYKGYMICFIGDTTCVQYFLSLQGGFLGVAKPSRSAL